MKDAAIREHLCDLMRGGGAHVTFEEAFGDVPEGKRGVRPAGLPWSLWELLEHVRIAQWDILEFSRDSKHVSPPHPAGYWPGAAAPASPADWGKSYDRVLADRAAMEALVRDPKNDLLKPFPWGDGQHLLREATLVADHNAYHIGQAIAVRRLLDDWSG